MTITFEIPGDIEEQLWSSGADPNQTAKELLLIELYRQRRITHHRVAQALGLSRYEVDGLLKRYDVPLDLTLDELRAEALCLRGLR
ncbi:hypothetical protein OJF2_75980 [Aquisphaera giovannonii]|uniref:Uncharacterized protein n=1 Tax=Aquisphaera giovannonii TaxID=406548 RepID=A0A5B9WEA5_9BACT|nr:UPF0175 family protein [Aquisphaera giovannonii]QEH38986.1 hypothetical protein OJF2_75980 [Aquisphaera giovannonii]